jgi:hypothetical protein
MFCNLNSYYTFGPDKSSDDPVSKTGSFSNRINIWEYLNEGISSNELFLQHRGFGIQKMRIGPSEKEACCISAILFGHSN